MADSSLKHAASLVPVGAFAGKPAMPLTRSVIVVGSGAHNRVLLKSETVSTQHTLLVHTEAGWYFRDLVSRTHTILNGKPQRESLLKSGDTLTIGAFVFHFVSVGHPEPVRPVAPAAMEITDAEIPVPIDTRTVLIGRRVGCEVRLIEDSVSLVHAIIFEADGQHYIRDLYSRTGTFLNGKKIHQERLRFGDIVVVGETTIKYVPDQWAAGAPDVAVEAVVPEEGKEGLVVPTLDVPVVEVPEASPASPAAAFSSTAELDLVSESPIHIKPEMNPVEPPAPTRSMKVESVDEHLLDEAPLAPDASAPVPLDIATPAAPIEPAEPTPQTPVGDLSKATSTPIADEPPAKPAPLEIRAALPIGLSTLLDIPARTPAKSADVTPAASPVPLDDEVHEAPHDAQDAQNAQDAQDTLEPAAPETVADFEDEAPVLPLGSRDVFAPADEVADELTEELAEAPTEAPAESPVEEVSDEPVSPLAEQLAENLEASLDEPAVANQAISVEDDVADEVADEIAEEPVDVVESAESIEDDVFGEPAAPVAEATPVDNASATLEPLGELERDEAIAEVPAEVTRDATAEEIPLAAASVAEEVARHDDHHDEYHDEPHPDDSIAGHPPLIASELSIAPPPAELDPALPADMTELAQLQMRIREALNDPSTLLASPLLSPENEAPMPAPSTSDAARRARALASLLESHEEIEEEAEREAAAISFDTPGVEDATPTIEAPAEVETTAEAITPDTAEPEVVEDAAAVEEELVEASSDEASSDIDETAEAASAERIAVDPLAADEALATTLDAPVESPEQPVEAAVPHIEEETSPIADEVIEPVAEAISEPLAEVEPVAEVEAVAESVVAAPIEPIAEVAAPSFVEPDIAAQAAVVDDALPALTFDEAPTPAPRISEEPLTFAEVEAPAPIQIAEPEPLALGEALTASADLAEALPTETIDADVADRLVVDRVLPEVPAEAIEPTTLALAAGESAVAGDETVSAAHETAELPPQTQDLTAEPTADVVVPVELEPAAEAGTEQPIEEPVEEPVISAAAEDVVVEPVAEAPVAVEAPIEVSVEPSAEVPVDIELSEAAAETVEAVAESQAETLAETLAETPDETPAQPVLPVAEADDHTFKLPPDATLDVTLGAPVPADDEVLLPRMSTLTEPGEAENKPGRKTRKPRKSVAKTRKAPKAVEASDEALADATPAIQETPTIADLTPAEAAQVDAPSDAVHVEVEAPADSVAPLAEVLEEAPSTLDAIAEASAPEPLSVDEVLEPTNLIVEPGERPVVQPEELAPVEIDDINAGEVVQTAPVTIEQTEVELVSPMLEEDASAVQERDAIDGMTTEEVIDVEATPVADADDALQAVEEPIFEALTDGVTETDAVTDTVAFVAGPVESADVDEAQPLASDAVTIEGASVGSTIESFDAISSDVVGELPEAVEPLEAPDALAFDVPAGTVGEVLNEAIADEPVEVEGAPMMRLAVDSLNGVAATTDESQQIAADVDAAFAEAKNDLAPEATTTEEVVDRPAGPSRSVSIQPARPTSVVNVNVPDLDELEATFRDAFAEALAMADAALGEKPAPKAPPQVQNVEQAPPAMVGAPIAPAAPTDLPVMNRAKAAPKWELDESLLEKYEQDQKAMNPMSGSMGMSGEAAFMNLGGIGWIGDDSADTYEQIPTSLRPTPFPTGPQPMGRGGYGAPRQSRKRRPVKSEETSTHGEGEPQLEPQAAALPVPDAGIDSLIEDSVDAPATDASSVTQMPIEESTRESTQTLDLAESQVVESAEPLAEAPLIHAEPEEQSTAAVEAPAAPMPVAEAPVTPPATVLPPRPKRAPRPSRAAVDDSLESAVAASPFAEQALPLVDAFSQGATAELDDMLTRIDDAGSQLKDHPPVTHDVPVAPRGTPSPFASHVPIQTRIAPGVRRQRTQISKLPLLSILMISLMSIAALASWMAPVSKTITGSVVFENLEKQTSVEQANLQDKIRKSIPLARQIANGKIDDRYRRGFLDDVEAFTAVVEGARFENGNTLVLQYKSSVNQTSRDLARLSELLAAIPAANQDLVDARNRLAEAAKQLDDSIAKRKRDKDTNEAEMKRLRAIVEGAPDTSFLNKQERELATLETARKEAVRLLDEKEAELKRLEMNPLSFVPASLLAPEPMVLDESAMFADADDGVALAPTTQPATDWHAKVAELTAQRDALKKRLDQLVAAQTPEARKARDSFDQSLSAFASDVEAARRSLGDRPEVLAYVENAQKLQEQIRSTTDTLVRRQQQQLTRLAEFQQQLKELTESTRDQRMASDPEMKEWSDSLGFQERKLNAAREAGASANELSDIESQIKLLNNMIAAKRETLADPKASTVTKQLEDMITLTKRDMDADRTQNEKLLAEVQENFRRQQPAVEKLPDDQKQLSETLAARLAQIDLARQRYTNSLALRAGGDEAEISELRDKLAAIEPTLADAIAQASQADTEQVAQAAEMERRAAAATLLDTARKAVADARVARDQAESAYNTRLAYVEGIRSKVAQANSAALKKDELDAKNTSIDKDIARAIEDRDHYKMSLDFAVVPMIPKSGHFESVVLDGQRMDPRLTWGTGTVALIGLLFAPLMYRESRQRLPQASAVQAESNIPNNARTA